MNLAAAETPAELASRTSAAAYLRRPERLRRRAVGEGDDPLAQDNLRSLNGIVDINTDRVRTGDLAGSRSNGRAWRQCSIRPRSDRRNCSCGRRRAAGSSCWPGPPEDMEVAGHIRRDERGGRLDGIRIRAQATPSGPTRGSADSGPQSGGYPPANRPGQDRLHHRHGV